jgi:hypothetical protein
MKLKENCKIAANEKIFLGSSHGTWNIQVYKNIQLVYNSELTTDWGVEWFYYQGFKQLFSQT